jgi:hypothetical protein
MSEEEIEIKWVLYKTSYKKSKKKLKLCDEQNEDFPTAFFRLQIQERRRQIYNRNKHF